MSEHSPTPWELAGNRGRTISDANGYPVAYAILTANAEFIHRACNAHDDLLAACEEALEMIEGEWNPCSHYAAKTDEERDMDSCTQCQLRAAIAKAKG